MSHVAEEAAYKCITHYQQTWIFRPENDCSLIGYVTGWIYGDEGIEAVQGSFEIFMQTVLIIIDEWHKDPSLLDYRKVMSDGRLWRRKRRPPLIFNDYNRRWVLDRAFFNSTVALYHHRQKS